MGEATPEGTGQHRPPRRGFIDRVDRIPKLANKEAREDKKAVRAEEKLELEAKADKLVLEKAKSMR